MKKIMLSFFVCICVCASVQAQDKNLTKEKKTKKYITEISKQLCDCMTPKFKDFSPEFHQLFKKIAQDFKKNKTANMQPM